MPLVADRPQAEPPLDHERTYTQAEYARLPEGPPFYELEDGRLVEMPRPARDHYLLAIFLIQVLAAYIKEHALGELALEPNLYLPDSNSVLHPDLAFVGTENMTIVKANGIHGSADMACEIISPSTASRDRGRKRELYAEASVQHLWLIDPTRPVMVEEFLLNDEGRYVLVNSPVAPADWRPGLFSELTISLAELGNAQL